MFKLSTIGNEFLIIKNYLFFRAQYKNIYWSLSPRVISCHSHNCHWWNSCSSVGSQEKYFTEPHTGGYGLARFFWVDICPWVSNVPSPSVLPWKKSNYVLSKAKTKARVQNFCLTLKLSLPEPVWSAEDYMASGHTTACVPVKSVYMDGVSAGH